MYARVVNGVEQEFYGDILQYTRDEDGTMYYIQIINPTERDFNDAGFYRVHIPGEAGKEE